MIYIGNGIYADSENTLSHHGVKGMHWGVRHDEQYQGGGRKRRKKKSMKKWMEDKDRANLANAQANKFQLKVDGEAKINGKTKKLPKSPFGMLMNYNKLSESEYNQAMKQIRRRNEVFDNAINDAYRLHRVVNFAPTVFNDAVKLGKNISYVAQAMQKRKMNSGDRVLGAKQQIVSAPVVNAMKLTKAKPQASQQFNNEIIKELKKMKGGSATHSDMLRQGLYLEHYGRKGMKWGQHIFGEDKNTNKTEPSNIDTILKNFKKKNGLEITWDKDVKPLSKTEHENLKKALNNFSSHKTKDIEFLNKINALDDFGIDKKTLDKNKNNFKPFSVYVENGGGDNKLLVVAYEHPLTGTYYWAVETNLKNGNKDVMSGD